MKKRKTIIDSAIRQVSPRRFDVTSVLEISHEAEGTKPLIYYLISHLVDIPKHTATVFQNFNNKLFKKLKEIGIHLDIGEAGLSQACKGVADKIKGDKKLKRKIERLEKLLGL